MKRDPIFRRFVVKILKMFSTKMKTLICHPYQIKSVCSLAYLSLKKKFFFSSAITITVCKIVFQRSFNFFQSCDAYEEAIKQNNIQANVGDIDCTLIETVIPPETAASENDSELLNFDEEIYSPDGRLY